MAFNPGKEAAMLTAEQRDHDERTSEDLADALIDAAKARHERDALRAQLLEALSDLNTAMDECDKLRAQLAAIHEQSAAEEKETLARLGDFDTAIKSAIDIANSKRKGPAVK